ncbi:MAG: histidine kinase [Angelakisella sp.]
MIKQSFHGINRRICAAFILITSALVLTVSAVLIVTSRTIMNQRMIDNQKIFLRQNQTNVQNLVNGFNQISVNLTTDRLMADILLQTDRNELMLFNDGLTLKQQFKRYVNAPLSHYLTTYYSNRYLFDHFEVTQTLANAGLDYNPETLSGVYKAEQIMSEPWAERTMEKNGQLHTFVLPDDPEAVYLARLIKNMYLPADDYNQAVGIMIVGLSMNQFKNQVEALALTEHAEVYIINQEDAIPQIIYSSDADSAGASLMDNEKLRAVASLATEKTVKIAGQKYFFMKYSTYWGWDIVSLIPLRDIQQETNGLLWVAVSVSALGVIIGSILIAITSYTVTKPLVDLTNVMRDINRSGDVTQYPRPVIRHNDEIALLDETFNNLMNRIEQLIHEGYESGVREKEMELLALQAQINPHFIYNALDSINWLALCNGNDDIADIVTSLAEIMRYSIKNPYALVSLRDELTHVENYIKIQAKQSQYAIDIEFDIPKEYLTMQMPKFLIEPLVENCVVHGLRNKLQNGRIVISCVREAELLFLRVRDNGMGADVVKLNQYMVGEIPSLARSDGFGIKNIDERIKLNYGNAYGLCFYINQEKGLTAQIVLPYCDPPKETVE